MAADDFQARLSALMDEHVTSLAKPQTGGKGGDAKGKKGKGKGTGEGGAKGSKELMRKASSGVGAGGSKDKATSKGR
jgi:hypothetical protein